MLQQIHEIEQVMMLGFYDLFKNTENLDAGSQNLGDLLVTCHMGTIKRMILGLHLTVCSLEICRGLCLVCNYGFGYSGFPRHLRETLDHHSSSQLVMNRSCKI